MAEVNFICKDSVSCILFQMKNVIKECKEMSASELDKMGCVLAVLPI